jgi:hypothetical protein
MKKLVINPVPAGVTAAVAAQMSAAINGMKPYHVPITNEERIGKRNMAEGREGFVRLVSKVALQHSNSLSKMDDPNELVQMLETDSQLESLRQAAMQLLEMVDDTQFANSCDIMLLSDSYAAALQSARTRSTALDSALNEIDEWNKRYKGSDNAAPPPAAV